MGLIRSMAQVESKTPEDSAVNDYVYKIFPYDLNDLGTMFGGAVASQLDRVAVVVAQRHSQKVCVTASIDAVHFIAPARKGDNLIIQAAVNRAWNTSMEIGLKVLVENAYLGERKHIVSAYFTFVALDDVGKPTAVPSITPKTAPQKRRYQEAGKRRQIRLRAASELAEFRKSFSKES